jgi:hypothetical protein
MNLSRGERERTGKYVRILHFKAEVFKNVNVTSEVCLQGPVFPSSEPY